jgi:hypothetical protein
LLSNPHGSVPDRIKLHDARHRGRGDQGAFLWSMRRRRGLSRREQAP